MEENDLNLSENYIDVGSILQNQFNLEQQLAESTAAMEAFKAQFQEQQAADEEEFNQLLLGVNEDIETLKSGGIKFPPIDTSIIIDAIIQKLLEKLEPYKSLILQAVQIYKEKVDENCQINSEVMREAWNRYIWDPTKYNTTEEDQIIPGGLKQYMDGSVMKEQIKNEVDKMVDLYKSLIDTIKNFGLSLSTLPAVLAPFTGGGAPAAVPSMMFNLLSQLSTIVNMATSVMSSIAYLKPPVDIFKALVTPVRAMLAPIIEIKEMIMGFLAQGMTIPAFDPEKTPTLGFLPMTDQNVPDAQIYLAVKDYGKIKTGENKVPSRYFIDGTYQNQVGAIETATGTWFLQASWNWDDYWKKVEDYELESAYVKNDIVIYYKMKDIGPNTENTATELTGTWDKTGKTFWKCVAETFNPGYTSDSEPGEGFWLENWIEIDPSGPEKYDETKEYKKGERVLYTLNEYENINGVIVVSFSDPPPAGSKKVTRTYEALEDVAAQSTEEWTNGNIPGMFAEGNFTGYFGYDHIIWNDVTPRPGYIYGPGDLVSYKKKIWNNKQQMPAIFEVEEPDDDEE